jgi:predicted component of type VI protein secretion system
MKPFYFILPAVILLVVAAADLSQRGAFDFLLKGKADAAEEKVREELAALQKVDFDNKLRELNRTRQLQGLPTYNVR